MTAVSYLGKPKLPIPDAPYRKITLWGTKEILHIAGKESDTFGDVISQIARILGDNPLYPLANSNPQSWNLVNDLDIEVSKKHCLGIIKPLQYFGGGLVSSSSGGTYTLIFAEEWQASRDERRRLNKRWEENPKPQEALSEESTTPEETTAPIDSSPPEVPSPMQLTVEFDTGSGFNLFLRGASADSKKPMDWEEDLPLQNLGPSTWEIKLPLDASLTYTLVIKPVDKTGQPDLNRDTWKWLQGGNRTLEVGAKQSPNDFSF